MDILPGIVASAVTLVVSILAFWQYRARRKDGLANKSEEIAKQKTRALYWYMEQYHRVRRIIVDQCDPKLLEGIPFEPPEHILKGEVEKET